VQVRDQVLWRRTGELQIGTCASRAVTLRGLSPAEAALLLDLQVPRSREWLEDALARNGIAADRWESLWRAASTPPPRRADHPDRQVIALLDDHELTVRAGADLARRGARLVRDGQGPGALPALALLTDAYVSDPLRTAVLLRHDIPHLPIVVEDDGVTLGPVVRPGVTGCCRCLELARTDADECWPALATQLRVLPTPPVDVEVARVAIPIASRVAHAHLAGHVHGGGFRITAHTLLPVDPIPVHPACACAGLTPPSGDAHVPA